MVDLSLGKIASGKGGLSIGVIVLLTQLFLWLNAGSIYGEFAGEAARQLQVYILMLTSVVVVTGVKPRILQADIGEIYNFLAAFIGTAVFLLTINLFANVGFGALQASAGVPIMLLQAFAVAYTEEIVFRGILPEVMGTDLFPNLLFGPFHWYTYGGDWTMMIFASLLGFGFAIVRMFLGLMGSTGAHTAWNLNAMGVLEDLVRGSV